MDHVCPSTFTVTSLLKQHSWSYVRGSETDTLMTLKMWLQERVEAFEPDIILMVGPEFPYPLPNELLLTDLLPEHRCLHVLVSDHPRETIPWRVLNHPLCHHASELRLDRMTPDDLRYIPFWIVSYSHRVCYRVRQVVMNCRQPQFDDVLRAVVEALDNAYLVDSRPYFPMRYVIEGVTDESDRNRVDDLLVYVAEKLTDGAIYRRLKWYVVGSSSSPPEEVSIPWVPPTYLAL